MTYDSEFPVYGNVTSIDQVERIQEYVDNKILDALGWIAGKFDLIVRGHTLVIGTIIETSGKQMKQEQRRIQRVIDKNEKTAELAGWVGTVPYTPIPPGEEPRPDDPLPPIFEPFPDPEPEPDEPEPPVFPPSEPQSPNPNYPPIDIDYPNQEPELPDFPSPPLPPLPPPPQPPTLPPALPPIAITPGATCNWGTSSQITSGLPTIPSSGYRGVLVYGGQMNNCVSVGEYRDSAKDTLHDIFGNSEQTFHIPGTLFPATNGTIHWTHESDVHDRSLRVFNYNAPKITTAASSPFEELGEAVARGNRKLSDGQILPFGGSYYPDWMHDTTPFISTNKEPDGIASLSDNLPDTRI